MLAAALPDFDPLRPETEIYMPIGIERFEMRRRGEDWLTSRMWLESPAEAAPETRIGHGTIQDAEGQVVARITGLHLKRAPKAALTQNSASSLEECFYEVHWEESPAVKASSTGARSNPSPATTANSISGIATL